jgi:hypothetical protein
MDGLSRNDSFFTKFRNKLTNLAFVICNLIEEDLRKITFDIRPLYPKLARINMRYNNNIQSLQIIGTAAEALSLNGSISSNLIHLCLNDNPVFMNLKSPETPNHAAMVSLLQTFQRLHKIRYEENNASTYSSIIDYWTMLNQGRRFLVDGGTSSNDNEQQRQISLNLWPNVLERAYNKQKNSTPMFYLVRHLYPNYISSLLPKSSLSSTTETEKQTQTQTTKPSTTTTTAAADTSSSSSSSSSSSGGNSNVVDDDRNTTDNNKRKRKR